MQWRESPTTTTHTHPYSSQRAYFFLFSLSAQASLRLHQLYPYIFLLVSTGAFPPHLPATQGQELPASSEVLLPSQQGKNWK